MNLRIWIGSGLLLLSVVGAGGGLAVWKHAALQAEHAAAAKQPEPVEVVTTAITREREYRPTTTSIGTVLALQSITLRNELSGTVRDVALTPGAIVEAGTVLVALDVSVEEAELAANEAQAAFAETEFARVQRLMEGEAAASVELERARAERDVAVAQVERTKAIIARKMIRAPFRARVGLADVHPGQYLVEGTALTTLQGVADAVHVDFTVAQQVAAGLSAGELVDIIAAPDAPPLPARIVARDARVDPTTRNAWVRARVDDADMLTPGASVRVRVPVGPPTTASVVPVNAVRKDPGGDHVFVITPDANGKPRAHQRRVQAGAMLGDETLIDAGLAAGERVAAAGSFKLREGALVAVASELEGGAHAAR